MATLAISHATGATPATYNLTSQVGEVVTITVTLTNANGTARDCTGGTIQWEFEPRGATGGPNYLEAQGNGTGIHTLTVPFSVARLLAGTYQHDCWYLAADGSREQISATSSWQVARGVGPVNDEPLTTAASTGRIYYGVGAAGLTGTATIEAALSYVDASLPTTFSATPSSQKVYVAIKAATGSTAWTLDGIPVSELELRYVSLHDETGALVSYVLHETTNLLTGTAIPFTVRAA